MTDTHFRFAEIEYGNSPADEKIVGVFRFEQQNNKQGPQHIVVAEVFSTLYAYERLLDLISTTVDQSRALTSGMTIDAFARFEKLIQRINEAVQSFEEKEPTPINWSRVNIMIVECSQGQLCVSGHGSLMNIYLQHKEDKTYQAFDLCGSLEQPAAADSKKIFSSVLCGDMKPGDLFFLGSSNFDRLKEELSIKQKLMTEPPISAAMEIKQGLEKAGIPDDFAGIIISCHAANQAGKSQPAEQPKKNQAQESMRQLIDNELNTSQTLAPLLNPVKNNKPSSLAPAPASVPPAKNGSGNSWLWIWLGKLKKIKKAKTPPLTPAAETTMRGLDAGHKNLFTTGRKIAIGALAILMAVSVITYSTVKHNKEVAAEQTQWEEAFNQAADFRNRAESSLMYARDSQTKSEIKSSEEIIAGLDLSTPDRQERTAKLQSELDQIKEKLRKAYTASGIIELYSLPATAPDGQLSAPVLTEKSAYIADNTNRLIVKIDLNSRAALNIALPEKATKIVSGAIGDKSLVFLDDSGQFIALNLETDAIQALNQFNKTTSTQDLAIYNQRAYILDGVQGQIHRLSKTGAGFGSPANYTAAGENSAVNGVSLAIDSNVYVGKSDGTVVKLLSGKQEPFSLGTVDPPLKSLSAIWTETDDSRLLATDPAEKRLLIFDKNGLLSAQLSSPEFTALRDVTGRLGEKRALVVSGNRLLIVPLP
ncbi:MAG TPA: hypothetical protein PLF71_04085 [bacterium]|nr:MAG: hypothetical protein BWY14_00587 [Parcubacteria group bacterium ADurb.Bin192]HPN15262.1 hypothetical protein [bacterium]